MNPTTILNAMVNARTDMELIAGIRGRKEPSISTGTDRLAKKWQKRVRQYNKCFNNLGVAIINLEARKKEVEYAVVLVGQIFDDGDGGGWRGAMNQFLVRNRRRK